MPDKQPVVHGNQSGSAGPFMMDGMGLTRAPTLGGTVGRMIRRPWHLWVWGLAGAAALAGGPGCSVTESAARPGIRAAVMAPARFDPSASAELEVRSPLLVRPRINGKEVGWFFLDSGATGMVISPAAARAAGMEEAGRVRVVGASKFDAGGWRCQSFELGPLALENVPFAGVDVGFITPERGTEVVGIVGADVFRAAVVEIDMARTRVRLYDPTVYALGRGSWQRVEEVPGGLATRIRYEGGREGLFVIDTGGDFGMALDTGNPENAAMMKGRPTRRQVLRGVGGIETGRAGRLDWIDLGGAVLPNVEVRFFSTGQLPGAAQGLKGLVGSQVLKEYVVILDWGHGRGAFVAKE